MKELNLKELEQIDGGLILPAQKSTQGGTIYYFDVIDDETGEVLASYNNEYAAWDYCKTHNIDDMYTDWETVKRLREKRA